MRNAEIVPQRVFHACSRLRVEGGDSWPHWSSILDGVGTEMTQDMSRAERIICEFMYPQSGVVLL